jgi:hypothetical protein
MLQILAKAASKASDLAGQQIDKLADPSATHEERQQRKRRLLKGAQRVQRYSPGSCQAQALRTGRLSHCRMSPSGPNHGRKGLDGRGCHPHYHEPNRSRGGRRHDSPLPAALVDRPAPGKFRNHGRRGAGAGLRLFSRTRPAGGRR